ncbi:MAG: Na(+)-translocating NADH-quinone reductase subunit C [Alcanivoracaceae bacterium]
MAFNKDSVSGTLIVAVSVCLVCAIVVATAAVGLRPTQEQNRLLDKRMNVLQAAGLYQPGMDVDAAFERIERRFVDLDSGEFVDMPESYDQRRAVRDPEASVRLSSAEDIASIRHRPNVAEIYLSVDDAGEVQVIILPVSGYGLWSTLHGFLALKPDVNTVAGLGFYEHAETPGLGGEVDNPRWKGLWPGKALYNEQGDLAIEVVKGTVDPSSPAARHQIDGLAGATLTTKGIDNLIQFWLGEKGFGPFLSRLRSASAESVEEAEEDALTLSAVN